jgi:hypothetical protein
LNFGDSFVSNPRLKGELLQGLWIILIV